MYWNQDVRGEQEKLHRGTVETGGDYDRSPDGLPQGGQSGRDEHWKNQGDHGLEMEHLRDEYIHGFRRLVSSEEVVWELDIKREKSTYYGLHNSHY